MRAVEVSPAVNSTDPPLELRFAFSTAPALPQAEPAVFRSEPP